VERLLLIMTGKKRTKKNSLLIVFIILLIMVSGMWFNRHRLISYANRYPLTSKIVQKFIPIVNRIHSKSFIHTRYGMSLPDEIELEINVSQSSGPVRKFWNGIGMDSFNQGVLAPINRASIDSLVTLNNNSPESYRYVRTCGIYADRKTATKEDIGARVFQRNYNGDVHYNWRIVDAVCDYLVSRRLKPIISLTYMPDDLASIENHRNPWNLANISPPKDYDEWKNLIYETVKHLKQRYGEEEISTWYFEVWNEPDYHELFWISHKNGKYEGRGNHIEYFKLYDYAVAGAVEAQANIKIGGPVIAGDMELFIGPFIQHCKNGINYATGEQGTRLDFISRHHYGELDQRILPKYFNFINLVKSFSETNDNEYEIIISETGPSTQPQPWLNSRYVAAWIVKSVDGFYFIKDKYGGKFLPDITCFWTKPVPFNFNTHFGLMVALGDKWHPDAKRLVKRPAFNAFDMLSHLNGSRLNVVGTEYGDLVHGIATIDDKETVSIILYHLNEGDQYNLQQSRHKVMINLTNLSGDQYRMIEFRVDQRNSNGYQAWKESGASVDIFGEELERLQKKSGLNALRTLERVTTNLGNLTLEADISNNSVVMLLLEKIN